MISFLRINVTKVGNLIDNKILFQGERRIVFLRKNGVA